MCINLNDSEIKKVIINTELLPKNKTGKNDRVAMVKGLEHGHAYKIGLTVIYNNWDEYNTELTITKLLQNREWVVVKDTGENRFGSFALLFNSLLQGSFKKELQEQSDRYFQLVSEMNGKVNEANKVVDEQKEISRQLDIENSILKADKVLLETQAENYLMALEEKDYEIMKLEKRIEELQTNVVTELTLKDMITIGKLYTKKVLKLKSDEEFEKEVRKYLKH